MKKVILMLIVVSAAVSCKKETNNKLAFNEVQAVLISKVSPTNIDVVASTINWKGFKPTGEHQGTISLSKGVLEINQGELVGGSVVIDMTSILNTDMPADSEYNAKLVGHLKSADFFDVEKFPIALFEFTQVKKENNQFIISGNLTIKDVTKNISILATMNTENDITKLTSETFTIDRTDFNVRYGSKKFFDNLKDKFINDAFELSFELKTTAN